MSRWPPSMRERGAGTAAPLRANLVRGRPRQRGEWAGSIGRPSLPHDVDTEPMTARAEKVSRNGLSQTRIRRHRRWSRPRPPPDHHVIRVIKMIAVGVSEPGQGVAVHPWPGRRGHRASRTLRRARPRLDGEDHRGDRHEDSGGLRRLRTRVDRRDVRALSRGDSVCWSRPLVTAATPEMEMSRRIGLARSPCIGIVAAEGA
jgi:hypothetical protein